MNNISRFFVVFMGMLLSACISSTATPDLITPEPSITLVPASITPSPTITSSPTPRQPTPSPQPSASQTVVSTPTTVADFEPQLIHICPDHPFVALEDIGLSPDVRLVLVHPTYLPGKPVEEGFWVQSPQDREPQAILRVVPGAGMVNEDYQLSPDGHFVSFWQMVKNAEDSDSVLATLWVSSLDGEQLWPVKQIHRDSNSLWVTEQDILIYEAGSDRATRIRLNPFTREEELLSPLPSHELEPAFPIDRYESDHFIQNGIFFTIYVDPYPDPYSYFLFDQSNNTAARIFSWSDYRLYLDSYYWRLADNTFLATVELPDGMDISTKLNLEMIQADHSYDGIMRHIRLPSEILPVDVWRVSSDGRKALLIQKDLEIDHPEPVEDYVLDLENMIVTSYCTESDREFGPIGEYFSISSISLSPDGQFAEIVYADGIHRSVGILNLETGHIARIEDYQMLGWGVTDLD